MAKCRICGAAHKACGGSPVVTPVDSFVRLNVTPNQGGIVTDLKRYNVKAAGRRGSVDTVQLLTAADAKAAGLTDKDLYEKPKAKAASSGSGSSSSGSTSGGGARSSRSRSSKASKAAATPANKAAAPAAAKDDAGAGSTGSAE